MNEIQEFILRRAMQKVANMEKEAAVWSPLLRTVVKTPGDRPYTAQVHEQNYGAISSNGLNNLNTGIYL